MVEIEIRRRKRPGDRWETIADVTTDPAKQLMLSEVATAESDTLSFRLRLPGRLAPRIRVFVGSVLAASTLSNDRVIPIHPDEEEWEQSRSLMRFEGRILKDWAGLTELAVELLPDDSSAWSKILVVPLAVSAGKMSADHFNQILAELERDSASVLLDIHGKTQLGLKEGQPLGSSAPITVLMRARETVRELNGLLHLIARQPASRLRTHCFREQALVGQAVSESSLAEACHDPSMLDRRGDAIVFREHLREQSRPDFRLPEHQLIADFADYLKAQLGDLRRRIDQETADREGRKRWRNHAAAPGQLTWWEVEDLPRIEELQRCRQEVAQLHAVIDHWSGWYFLPPGRGLREKPQPSPLFQHHALYRRVFRAMTNHFLTYQTTLDASRLLTRARSLPVLYEWWCAVRILRILARGLIPLVHESLERPILASEFSQNTRRFTIEFDADQEATFVDGRNNRVRLRYQPSYHGSLGANPAVAVLGPGSLRTPDLAIEVYTPGGDNTPRLIVILDAKYSSASQAVKMTEVSIKYSKIGDARTGRILSRQVWALTPAGVETGFSAPDDLASYCTVDNRAFWSSAFEAESAVTGAIQMRPIAPGSFDPLHALITRLLKLAGVEYAELTEGRIG